MRTGKVERGSRENKAISKLAEQEFGRNNNKNFKSYNDLSN